MSASDIETCTERFDLIVNIDLWTEMSRETADSYWKFARRSTNAVLSINHEHNAFTVRDLYSGDPDVTATRHPYWTRRGYVEELITGESKRVPGGEPHTFDNSRSPGRHGSPAIRCALPRNFCTTEPRHALVFTRPGTPTTTATMSQISAGLCVRRELCP